MTLKGIPGLLKWGGDLLHASQYTTYGDTKEQTP